MTGYMVVGKFDCPWYAKACIIVDCLTKQDPSRKFNMDKLGSHEWQEFIEETQVTRGWKIKKSPVIWEMLTDLEGKGNLIGDIDDFCEYVNLVFGLVIHVSTHEIEQVVCLNKTNFHRDSGSKSTGTAKILNIAIIQPPIRMSELLMTQLLSPFPITDPNTILNIRIYDKKTPTRAMQGFLMEVNDMASPFLYKITSCQSPKQCMYAAELVIIMQDFSQESHEDYSEWLSRVEISVQHYAEAIEESASMNCRILVGCNGPLCFIAETLRSKISTEKVENGFIATIGQHVVNHGKAELSKKVEFETGRISRLHAWGWPGLTGAWVEAKHAVVHDMYGAIQGPLPIYRPLVELAKHSYWVAHEFSDMYLTQQQALLKATPKKMYSDMCLVEAVVATLQVWFESTRIKVNQTNPRMKCPDPCKSDNKNELPQEPMVSLPVISVGIETAPNSGFPSGTFLVQPGVCYADRWFPTGRITESSSQRINRELNKLWSLRQGILRSKNFRRPDDDYEYNENQQEENGDLGQLISDYAQGSIVTSATTIESGDHGPQQFTDDYEYDEEEYNELYDQEYNKDNPYYNHSNDNVSVKGQEEPYSRESPEKLENYEIFP